MLEKDEAEFWSERSQKYEYNRMQFDLKFNRHTHRESRGYPQFEINYLEKVLKKKLFLNKETTESVTKILARKYVHCGGYRDTTRPTALLLTFYDKNMASAMITLWKEERSQIIDETEDI